MSRYRFALRPKWILSHIFVLVMVLAMVRAGFWQIDRLHQRRAMNARVEAVQQRPPVPVNDLAGPGDYAKGKSLSYLPVTATGTYLTDQSFLVDGPDNKGSPGAWVVTPLKLDDGGVVMIKRGTIPDPGQLAAVPDSVETPSGTVTVEGLARPTETQPKVNLGFKVVHFERADPATGTITDAARMDLARLQQQIDGELLPFYVSLRTQDPAVTAAEPLPPTPPDVTDQGPHLSYAIQWFTFTLMTLIIYPLILRRRAREIEREERDAQLDAEAAARGEGESSSDGDPDGDPQLVSPAAPAGDPSG